MLSYFYYSFFFGGGAVLRQIQSIQSSQGVQHGVSALTVLYLQKSSLTKGRDNIYSLICTTLVLNVIINIMSC